MSWPTRSSPVRPLDGLPRSWRSMLPRTPAGHRRGRRTSCSGSPAREWGSRSCIVAQSSPRRSGAFGCGRWAERGSFRAVLAAAPPVAVVLYAWSLLEAPVAWGAFLVAGFLALLAAVLRDTRWRLAAGGVGGGAAG